MTASKTKLSTDRVLKGLDELRNQALLCDVHLVAEGAKFPAHRVILAAASPYFQAMFTGGFKENQMNEITLNDTSSEGLECVLDAIYTADLSLSAENVCDVVSLASLLQLNEIVEHCGRFLARNVSTHNCLAFLSVAEKYDLQEAIDECDKFVLENFDTISQSIEFKKLSKQKLCHFLSDDQLKVRNGEIEVFRATHKWYEATQDDNIDVLAELMQHVRFPLIPSDVLLDEVLATSLVSENPQVMRMVTEALRFHSADNLFLQPLKDGKQFQPRGNPKLVVIQNVRENIGPTTKQETRMYMLNVNHDNRFSDQFSEQVLPRALYFGSFSVLREGNYLFVFGTDAEYFRPIAQRFDVKTNTWLDLKPLPYEAFTFTAAALLKGNIYLLGGMHIVKGIEGAICTSQFSASTAQYSIETNSWSKLQNLPKPVAFHSAATHGNYVFCAGGITNKASDKLYAFDVIDQLWLLEASMNYKRRQLGLEAVGAKLVACGGSTSPSVEIYDIADNQWSLIQNGTLGYCACIATVALNNKVYIFGGDVRDEGVTSLVTDFVTCVDVENATIHRMSNLPFRLTNHVCAMLTVPNTMRPDMLRESNN